MRQVTFQEYLYHRLSADFEVEDPYEQLEYVLTGEDHPEYDARVSSIRFKASNQFFEIIQSYRKALEKSGMVFKKITFRGETIATAQEIEEYFYADGNSSNLQHRLEKVKDWLLGKVRELEQQEWKKEWVEERIELLSDEEYYKAKKHLAKKAGFTRENSDDYEMDTKALAQLIVRQRLKRIRKSIRSFGFVDMITIYKQLFTEHGRIQEWMEDIPCDWPAICELTLQELEKGRIFYEDATPFL